MSRCLAVLVFVLLTASAPCSGAEEMISASYLAYRFEPAEGWRTSGAGALEGKTWTADFSKGASSIALSPPDQALPGRPVRLRLRFRGSAPGHPVRVSLRTHFMTFHKNVGEFTGGEMVIDAPPGPGWEWSGGENDGKLHGPIRVGEIRMEANGRKDAPRLELVSLTVDAEAPARRRATLTASVARDNATFVAEAQAMSDSPLEGDLKWTFRGWDGQELGVGSRRVTVPAGAERGRFEVPKPSVAAGVKFVEAEFRLEIPGQEIAPAETCWLAPQPPQTDTRLRPESPFGMGVYLYRSRGEELERTARAARDAGVKWSREEFSWARMEPERGRFDFQFYDDLVATAKRNGISVYAIVCYWSRWTKPYTEEGVEDYLRFLGALVERYKNDIHQWEIWNEPNIFFWDGPKDLYATLLTRSYALIKRLDPSAQVLGISTAGIDYDFIARMLARETPFDILTIHPYRRTLEDGIFINELKLASDMVGKRPVWLTEMGWATFAPHNALEQPFAPNSLRAQAEFLARTYLCSIVSGVEPRTFWYNFRNDGEDPIYFEHNMGILYRDYRPKPAYYAFSTLARTLDGMKLAGPADAPKGVFAYRFTGPAGEVIALWSPTADAEVALSLKADHATLVNAIGEERRIGPGSVRLRAGAPVYVKSGPVSR